MKKFFITILALSLIFVFSAQAFADSQITLTEAKEYLENYCVINTNSYGQEYTTRYVFNSEDELNNAAEYIVQHGINAFNVLINNGISNAVANEQQNNIILPRTTTPTIAYATVSSNGLHDVNAVAYGLADFDKHGTLEYQIDLGYTVHVSGGKFTHISAIYLDFPHMSPGGRYKDQAFYQHCYDYECGVTANYSITKTIGVPIGDLSIGVESEADLEYFALLTSMS